MVSTMVALFMLVVALKTVQSAKRSNVLVDGPTSAPGFQRASGKSKAKFTKKCYKISFYNILVGVACPESHPFPLDSYKSCCSSETKTSTGGRCDGGNMLGTDPLDCCTFNVQRSHAVPTERLLKELVI